MLITGPTDILLAYMDMIGESFNFRMVRCVVPTPDEPAVMILPVKMVFGSFKIFAITTF